MLTRIPKLNILNRSVAFLLVSSLVADPVTTTAFSHSFDAKVENRRLSVTNVQYEIDPTAFKEQALAARLLCALRAPREPMYFVVRAYKTVQAHKSVAAKWKPSRQTVLGWMPAVALVVGGYAVFLSGLTLNMSWREWVAQLAATTLWLTSIERAYRWIFRTTTPHASNVPEAIGEARTWRDRATLVGFVALLVPLSVVAEVTAQMFFNWLFYAAGWPEPIFIGWVRGGIDARHQAMALSLTADPLSRVTHWLLGIPWLGWRGEREVFALTVLASMVGNVIMTLISTAIGVGPLRQRFGLLARAFRVLALYAATAPILSISYFCFFGGDDINIWPALYRVLLGSFSAGSEIPMWIRIIGEVIYYFLPTGAIALRLWADRRAVVLSLGADAVTHPTASPVTLDKTPSSPARWRNGLFVTAIVAPLIAVWVTHLSLAGPASWLNQSIWIVLWLGYLELAHQAIWKRTPEGIAARFTTPSSRWQRIGLTLATISGAWPLAIAGVVVQTGLQWILAARWSHPAAVSLEFVGWLLGQVKVKGVYLPPFILGSTLLGNLIWSSLLLWLGTARWQLRNSLWARTMRLGAVQAASMSFVLGSYIAMSYLSKTEAAPGMGLFDVWQMWTFVIRAALNAPFIGESIPWWLPGIGILVGWFPMLFGFGKLRLRREQERWRSNTQNIPSGPSGRGNGGSPYSVLKYLQRAA